MELDTPDVDIVPVDPARAQARTVSAAPAMTSSHRTFGFRRPSRRTFGRYKTS